MHILLTNDDGIFAPGLAAVYQELVKLGQVTVAAPTDVQSAASHRISLEPVGCELVDILGAFSGFSIDGTPADCVKLALNELLDEEQEPVDLVVSGINYGANLGVHVYYSGTVAAAMEGAFHGIPAIALSAAYEESIDMEKAADYCRQTIERLLPLASGNVININIPRLSEGKPKGVKVVPHAATGYREGYEAKTGQDGQIIYTFTNGFPQHADHTEGTDTRWLADGYITVTALRLDMNDSLRNDQLRRLFER